MEKATRGVEGGLCRQKELLGEEAGRKEAKGSKSAHSSGQSSAGGTPLPGQGEGISYMGSSHPHPLLWGFTVPCLGMPWQEQNTLINFFLSCVTAGYATFWVM